MYLRYPTIGKGGKGISLQYPRKEKTEVDKRKEMIKRGN